MPATTFLNERVRFLLATFEQPLWFALAGANAWESDDCPPAIGSIRNDLPSTIGYTPVQTKSIVRRAEYGELDLPSGRYEIYKGERTESALVRAKALGIFYEGVVDTLHIGDYRRLRCTALCLLDNVTIPADFPFGGVIQHQSTIDVRVVWAATHRPVFTKFNRYYYFQVLRHF